MVQVAVLQTICYLPPPPPGVSIDFSLDSYEVPEENGTVTVCASLTGLTEIPVMIQLATTSGTAIQGNKFSIVHIPPNHPPPPEKHDIVRLKS